MEVVCRKILLVGYGYAAILYYCIKIVKLDIGLCSLHSLRRYG